jgi:hypothetical protein
LTRGSPAYGHQRCRPAPGRCFHRRGDRRPGHQPQQDHRLKWYADGRVRVLVGVVLPAGSAVKQTLAARRKRIRAALRERLARQGWEERGVNVYERIA